MSKHFSKGQFERLNKFEQKVKETGYVSDNFATYKAGFLNWVIIHTPTGHSLGTLAAQNAMTTKARIIALEEQLNPTNSDIFDLLLDNGCNTMVEFQQKCESIALGIQVGRQ